MSNNTIISNWNKLPVVLNLETVALIFNVSNGTVKRWLYDGTIKGSQIGRKWFFDKDYIKSLIETENANNTI